MITLIHFNVNAQASIKGSITDKNMQLLGNASVSLLQAKDSSLVKGSLTTSEGKFSFDKIQHGNYLIISSFTGYQHVFTPVTVAENSETIELPSIRLFDEIKVLADVKLIARKPLFEQKTDRMVINVASSITYAGGSALDVLERSPGVTVDRQNNLLAINGKNGVVVMINGRISRMPMSGLIQLLNDMNADNIEKIELITTPPANFDAEGDAGYINIVLKTNTLFGTNGFVSLTAGYSIFETTNGSINMNHRKDRVNIYGDYTFGRNDLLQHLNFYHAVNDEQGRFIENHSSSKRRPLERIHTFRTGIDYEINKKTIIGGLFSFYDRNWSMDAWNKGSVYINKHLDTIVNIYNYELHTLTNYSANLNLQRDYKEGQKLSLNFDYVYYKDWNPVSYLNEYRKGDGSFIRKQEVKSKKLTPIKFWVGSADFTKKLGKITDMEAGVKGTLSKFNNNVQIDRLDSTGWIKDPVLSNNYELNENITAGYFSLNVRASEKTSWKFGLRYEYTNSNLGSAFQKDIVDRHYGNFFPSMFFNHKFNDDNSANFSYSRRITRPTFNDMAPFVIFVDPNTYFSGNPGLQPSKSNSIGVAYTYKRKILSVSYTFESDPITNFSPKIDPKTNKLTLASENQKNKKILSMSISLPFEITKWWSMQNNLQGLTQQLNGWYGTESFRLKNKNFSINSTNTFRLPKEYTISVSGFYYSKSMFGIYVSEPFGSLDIGGQKKWPGSSLRINAVNILNTMIFQPSINLPDKNLVTEVFLQFRYPVFRITYTRNFGNSKLKQNRARSTAQEERARVQ